MTQYNDKVEMQRLILLAEEHVDTVTNIHAHSITSMWYETDKTIKDAVKGVVDTTYMDGRIERKVLETGKKYILVEGRTGADLVQEVTRNLADSGQSLD
tara:strand:+ start:23 stop:319 length:297 start_codon:yes stop_codon:yes gene_type:complete